MAVDYQKDSEENKEFDKTLNPKGDFQRPSVEQLKQGVKIRNKSRYSSGEGSKEFLNKSLQIGAALAPDPTNPAEMSELYMDLKSGMNAAKMAPGGPVIKGVAGVAGFGASRLSRKMGQEIIEQILGTKKVWDNGWKAALPDGRTVDWGSKWWSTTPDMPLTKTHMMAKAMDGGDKPSGWDQIPPENRDYTSPSSPVRKIDRLARVNKTRIRKYVQEFGGNEEDVTRIFNEHALKQKNINQSRSWLNSYFKKLNEGLGPDGLKNARIKDIDGVPTLVDGATEKAIAHPFEVDHSKAKELMAELGLEGADFHENLDTTLTVFNRAKNNLGNPSIPDDILRATGQSTSLREFVQRRLDSEFNAKFTTIPERLRGIARQRILEDVLASTPIKGKPGKIKEQIIEKHLKFWNNNSELIVQLDDYIPEEVLKDVDFFANPQQGYESLLNMDILDSLKPTFKKRVKRMADQWVTLNRGTQAVRDYFERTGGRTIKKKYGN